MSTSLFQNYGTQRWQVYIDFVPVLLFIDKGYDGFGIEGISRAAIHSFVAVEYFFPGWFPIRVNFPVVTHDRCHIQNREHIIFRKSTFSPENDYGFLAMFQIDPFESKIIELIFI